MTCSQSLQWRHNGRNSVSNHQPHHCLLNRLFRRRSKKASKLRVTGLCAGIYRWRVNSPHKWPVTRKFFTFDDVIMERFSSRVMCYAVPVIATSNTAFISKAEAINQIKLIRISPGPYLFSMAMAIVNICCLWAVSMMAGEAPRSTHSWLEASPRVGSGM